MCLLRCCGWTSLAFIRKEVFFLFGLYIILKRSWDTSLAHAHSAQREATLGSCSIVPGARVPNGIRVSDSCASHPSMRFQKLEAQRPDQLNSVHVVVSFVSICMLTIPVSNLFSHTVQFSLGRNVWKHDSSLCWCARIAAGVLRQLSRTIHLPFHFSTVRAHADSPRNVAPPRLASNCSSSCIAVLMYM